MQQESTTGYSRGPVHYDSKRNQVRATKASPAISRQDCEGSDLYWAQDAEEIGFFFFFKGKFKVKNENYFKIEVNRNSRNKQTKKSAIMVSWTSLGLTSVTTVLLCHHVRCASLAHTDTAFLM